MSVEIESEFEHAPPPQRFEKLHDLSERPGIHWTLPTLIVLVSWFVVSAVLAVVPVVIWVSADGDPATDFDLEKGSFVGINPVLNLLVAVFSFLASWPAIWLAVKIVHGRPFQSVLTAALRFRWNRLAISASLWSVLLAGFALVEAWLYPGRYILNDVSLWLTSVGVSLVLVTAQASLEEVFFRGYLLQVFTRWFRFVAIAAIVSTLIFGALHLGNPEVGAGFWWMLAFYMSMGAFLMLIAWREQGLEAVIGIHVANNLFNACLANYADSALPTAALFTVAVLDAPLSLAAFVISAVLFVILLATWDHLMAHPVADAVNH